VDPCRDRGRVLVRPETGHISSGQPRRTASRYGAAIRNNPAYRSDSTLIRDVIGCLVSDLFHTKCADFLAQKVGAPAASYLEKAARAHAYASVCIRAARIVTKLTAQR
jgi:hypothetical protein